jgi:hypothetical protein
VADGRGATLGNRGGLAECTSTARGVTFRAAAGWEDDGLENRSAVLVWSLETLGRDDMTKKTALQAIRGFVGTTLLGVCLFGLPLVLYGAWGAWTEPVVLVGKRRGEKQTVLGRATETFCVGAFIGGISGMIVGTGVAAKRLWSSD